MAAGCVRCGLGPRRGRAGSHELAAARADVDGGSADLPIWSYWTSASSPRSTAPAFTPSSTLADRGRRYGGRLTLVRGPGEVDRELTLNGVSDQYAGLRPPPGRARRNPAEGLKVSGHEYRYRPREGRCRTRPEVLRVQSLDGGPLPSGHVRDSAEVSPLSLHGAVTGVTAPPIPVRSRRNLCSVDRSLESNEFRG